MLLIKEGTLQPTINGVKQQPAGPGSLIFFASHDVHNATNVGDKPTTYYVINYYTAAAANGAQPAGSRMEHCRTAAFLGHYLGLAEAGNGCERRAPDALSEFSYSHLLET